MAVGNSSNGDASIQEIEKLLNSLEQIFNKIDRDEEEKIFLTEYLKGPAVKSLLLVYEKVHSHGHRPCTHNSLSLSEEVFVVVSEYGTSRLAKELLRLLENPFFKTFLEACDLVAKKEFSPTLPDFSLDLEDEEETVKIVQLVKSNEPLGATIKYDQEAGAIVIARIMHGGAADRSGLIHIGDEVHEVNGIDVKGKPPCELVKILELSREGPITFKLVPGEEWPSSFGPESRVRVRAHFCYDPGLDPSIPCREAGLGFVRGEVLHVVNQTDPGWWQARRHGDQASSCAGLVPSRQLMERRLASLRDLTPPSLHPRRIRKIMYHAAENDDFDREELATYEEVAVLYPTPGFHRPVILVGAPGIGRNELRRRLCQMDPCLYRNPVAHTSRPPRPWEVDGHDYYFASRSFMDARRHRFVELGEYQGHLYGTSLDTVEQIVLTGQVCLMAPHPQALKKLRHPDIKPYMVFIKAPPFELLKESRTEARARSTFDENCSRGFTDEEFEEMVYESQKLEYLYGHMFDAVVTNLHLSTALRELVAIVSQVDSGPHWVPASWVTPAS